MIGEENNGFKMIIHGMNAERILIAAEALGLGYAALRRAAKYANERQVRETEWAKLGHSTPTR